MIAKNVVYTVQETHLIALTVVVMRLSAIAIDVTDAGLHANAVPVLAFLCGQRVYRGICADV
jgi:hypothetical protein